MPNTGLAKLLMLVGGILFAAGLLLLLLGKILPSLPGDIFIKRGNFTFYFPLVSCLIISIILSVLLNLFHR